jgi:hypothetical protein
VLSTRLQVLANGDDVRAVGGDVAQRLFDLGLSFTEAEHDAGFRHESAALAWRSTERERS